jgi:hypothetical protein
MELRRRRAQHLVEEPGKVKISVAERPRSAVRGGTRLGLS